MASWRRTGLGLLIAALLAGACSASVDDSTDTDLTAPPDPAAQFVVRCELSHVAFDDPLVLPWQPGKSHLHLFFGNSRVDSDPGYDDRLLSADTSCEQQRDTASYWAPALLDPTGKAVEPIGLTAFHRPGRGVAPEDVVAYPEGIMIIGGDQTAEEEQSTNVVAWSCGTDTARNERPTQCDGGSTLRMLVVFPDCWDGERLTGFGSSAHVRYSDDGCPDTHAVPLPQLTVAIDYPPVAPDDLSLSSGGIETAHADFWNVWDQAKLEADVAMCINSDIVCDASS